MERMRETQRHTPFKGEMMKNYRRYVEAMYIWDTAVATIASVPRRVRLPNMQVPFEFCVQG